MIESRDMPDDDQSSNGGEFLVDVGLDFNWRFAVEYPHLFHSERHCFLLVCLDWQRDPTRHRTAVIEWVKCDYAFLSPSSEENRVDWGWFSDPRSNDLEMGEVVNSIWLQNTTNPAWLRGDLRHHYVIAFHDTVFQCLAEGFRSRTDPRPLVEVLPDVAAEILARWRDERSEWEASASFRRESEHGYVGPRVGWPWEWR